MSVDLGLLLLLRATSAPPESRCHVADSSCETPPEPGDVHRRRSARRPPSAPEPAAISTRCPGRVPARRAACARRAQWHHR
ncbi:hypothetical protein ACFPRL_26785 [Pseudoclavibacter helvolus]